MLQGILRISPDTGFVSRDFLLVLDDTWKFVTWFPELASHKVA